MLANWQRSTPADDSVQNLLLPMIFAGARLAAAFDSEPDGVVGRFPLLMLLGDGLTGVVGAFCAFASVKPATNAAAVIVIESIFIACFPPC
jgi:hypothetical protein